MSSQSLTPEERERFHRLITAALDGELRKEDEHEFNTFLSTFSECKKEWDELKKIKEMAMQIRFTQPPEETWNRYWLNIYNRIERGIGWILVSLGVIVILVYGAFKVVESILADSSIEWFVKAGILAMLAGLIILLVSVLREKLFIKKSDKYKEIQR